MRVMWPSFCWWGGKCKAEGVKQSPLIHTWKNVMEKGENNANRARKYRMINK